MTDHEIALVHASSAKVFAAKITFGAMFNIRLSDTKPDLRAVRATPLAQQPKRLRQALALRTRGLPPNGTLCLPALNMPKTMLDTATADMPVAGNTS